MRILMLCFVRRVVDTRLLSLSGGPWSTEERRGMGAVLNWQLALGTSDFIIL